jgi:hypothetical protein
LALPRRRVVNATTHPRCPAAAISCYMPTATDQSEPRPVGGTDVETAPHACGRLDVGDMASCPARVHAVLPPRIRNRPRPSDPGQVHEDQPAVGTQHGAGHGGAGRPLRRGQVSG